MSTITATYLVHDVKGEMDKKAEGIAVGLTVGSWTDMPQIEREQLEKHKGTVLDIEQLPEDEKTNRYFGKKMTKGLIKIAYPAVNFSADLPAILTTVFGKLSLDGEIKLIDLEFSKELAAKFPGPRLGIEGIREMLGVYNRPLLMSIFKGVIGRDLDYLKEQLRAQALGGVDIIKDDEILFDNPLTPFAERVRSSRIVLDEVFAETGHRALYAVNLTGRTFELREKAKQAAQLGADMLLFNVFAYGLDILQSLREDEEIGLPIMAHPAVSGALSSSGFYGISRPLLLGKLLRYAGADLILFPSPYGSVAIPREDAVGIADEARKEEHSFRKSFPVPSAGIHPGLVPLLVRDFGVDHIVNAGGGIHGHPGGAEGGGRAFHTAIRASLEGENLLDAAKTSKELKQAIDLWGVKEVKV